MRERPDLYMHSDIREFNKAHFFPPLLLDGVYTGCTFIVNETAFYTNCL